MRWPWSSKEGVPGTRGHHTIVAPEDLALCVQRILEEREVQCRYKGEEYHGMTLEEIVKEVSLRLGSNWTVKDLQKGGF